MKKLLCYNLPPPPALSHPHIGKIITTYETTPADKDGLTVRMEETPTEKETFPLTTGNTPGELGKPPIPARFTKKTED